MIMFIYKFLFLFKMINRLTFLFLLLFYLIKKSFYSNLIGLSLIY